MCIDDESLLKIDATIDRNVVVLRIGVLLITDINYLEHNGLRLIKAYIYTLHSI